MVVGGEDVGESVIGGVVGTSVGIAVVIVMEGLIVVGMSEG